MKFVNRFVTAEDQGLKGVREGLVFPNKTVKGLQSTQEWGQNHQSNPICVLKLNLGPGVTSSNLCDDLQVFDKRPLCSQQFLGDEVGLICGKLLDTSTKT